MLEYRVIIAVALLLLTLEALLGAKHSQKAEIPVSRQREPAAVLPDDIQ